MPGLFFEILLRLRPCRGGHVPASRATIASWRPTSRLKIDDLPALVRPTIATIGSFLFDIVAKLYHKVYKNNTGATDVAPAGVCRGLLLWGMWPWRWGVFARCKSLLGFSLLSDEWRRCWQVFPLKTCRRRQSLLVTSYSGEHPRSHWCVA